MRRHEPVPLGRSLAAVLRASCCGMKMSPVDPRDQTWELDRPVYRVYFHDTAGTSEEFEVTGADADEVLAWAEAGRGRGTFVLYACVPGDPGLGLVRLAGHDPNTAG